MSIQSHISDSYMEDGKVSCSLITHHQTSSSERPPLTPLTMPVNPKTSPTTVASAKSSSPVPSPFLTPKSTSPEVVLTDAAALSLHRRHHLPPQHHPAPKRKRGHRDNSPPKEDGDAAAAAVAKNNTKSSSVTGSKDKLGGATAHAQPHGRKRRKGKGATRKDSISSHDGAMEINNHYSHIQRKDLPPQVASQLLARGAAAAAAGAGGGGGGGGGGVGVPSVMTDRELQTQLLSLKQQHQVQQQMLLQQFHEQQVRLAQEQDKQVADHIQRQAEYLEQQKALEEKQRIEKEKAEQQILEQIKNKRKEEESAIASSKVKQKLQEFVLNKKHREAHGKIGGSPPRFQQWSTQHSSLDQHSPPQSGLSPPYRPPHLLGQYEDFPLRKTVSDSNLKVRSKLKEKVVQRSSPLLRRKDLHSKRKTPLQVDTLSNSNPDSGPNSPPTNAHHVAAEAANLTGKEEGSPFPLQMMSKMVINQSMPNISIGHRDAPAGDPSQRSSMATEAELRARATAHYGMPLTHHMLPATLPFCPSLPVIDSEFTPPASPAAYLSSQQMKVLQEVQQARAGKMATSTSAVSGNAATALAGAPYTVPNNMAPITDAQVAQARIHRRPLARTQSAPLPLGHPLLNTPGLLLAHQEQLLAQQEENKKLYLKQRLQNTVLQRVGSKNHMENVDEEAEARLAQEMKEVRERELEEDVIVIREDGGAGPHPTSASQESSPDGSGPGDIGGSGGAHVPKSFRAAKRDAALIRQRTVSGGSPPIGGLPHRPLARTMSSPAVAVPLSPPQNPTSSNTNSITSTQQHSPQMMATDATKTFTTGLAYDTLMLKHSCICGNNANHPEHAGRLQSIWARFHETGLVNHCERIKSRKATIEELQSCHGDVYTQIYGTNSLNRQKLDPKLLESLPQRFCLLPCGGVGVDADTIWNDQHTASASRMAAGCVIELAFKVALGELKNGMAVVRPPGHHAEPNQAMGFCYFNSIAVAARQLQERLKLERILILDWDVHHGNSTQQIFYENKNVLYLSLHRHDSGNFFPGTGAAEECGAEDGVGFNVNIPWKGALNPPMGDAEYLTAFRTIVMPIARDFNPEIILVSAGFDAAAGHPPPLGGYMISSQLFGHMTNQLQTLADGKIVLVLEGGYDLPSICDASECCLQALLGEDIPPLKEEEVCRRPSQMAVETLETVIKLQATHWPNVERQTGSLGYSLREALQRDREEADTVSAFASLSVVREADASESFGGEASEDVAEPMEES